MGKVTRRDAMRGPALGGAAVALAMGDRAAAEAQPGEIRRYEPTPRLKGLPCISYAVAHGGLVHLAGVTASLRAPADVKVQTRLVLARIDQLLAAAGTDKSRLLSATVWLTDMANFTDHNDAWNEWVDPAHPPVRACLLSPQLWRPGLLVEIMATAAAR
jgi:enamine deaminase RidA (YjgF/YER057c/UK114 family)